MQVGQCVGAKCIDVAEERPDFCREAEIIPDELERVGGSMHQDPYRRELSEFSPIREARLDMVESAHFDEDTKMANDMARASDRCRIAICHYVGEEFIEIVRECPEYC